MKVFISPGWLPSAHLTMPNLSLPQAYTTALAVIEFGIVRDSA